MATLMLCAQGKCSIMTLLLSCSLFVKRMQLLSMKSRCWCARIVKKCKFALKSCQFALCNDHLRVTALSCRWKAQSHTPPTPTPRAPNSPNSSRSSNRTSRQHQPHTHSKQAVYSLQLRAARSPSSSSTHSLSDHRHSSSNKSSSISSTNSSRRHLSSTTR
jgi:hypothetical protein